ncbi:serine/threonine-protein kinase [Nocardioides zeicaulis]
MRRRIGSGAFATVWLAYDEHLDSLVAIKVLADNWSGDLHTRQRFLEEGRYLRKVESPHVVTVYDAGELDDERPYLVMAYADQGTLADRLELGPLDPGQALSVVCQVGEGLAALHDRGVLHRDVKPANVLFRTVETGRGAQVLAMLGDLGLGKAMDVSSRLTMVGGTPTYVAPEQAMGEALDARADQFSLGALSYYLLAGRQPFQHTTLAAAAEPEPPVPMGIDNAAAEAVVLRALSRDRDERFADVEAFTAALAEAFDGAVDEAPVAWIPVDDERTQASGRPAASGSTGRLSPATGPGRRRRTPWLVAGVVALAIGATSGWALERSSTSERTIQNDARTISVTVPESWTAQVDPDPWTPSEGGASQPALAVGSRTGWNTTAPAPGVFVGILAGDKLPTRVPQHPDCVNAGGEILDEIDGDASKMVVFTGCEGTEVVVERVVRVTTNYLLWEQVRADDSAEALRVLDSIEVLGY